ncbi:aminodeoxychorismate synthase component I, partial [Sphingobacterium shayense]|uniref:chorismate-binding protein n=1 Tax=Sphingobacterium shayense TaxID=626343 RepID=UPI001553C6EC
MAKAIFEVEIEFFRQQALDWADQFEEVCFFQSNGYHDEYSNINSLLAVHAKLKFEFFEQGDTFEQLEKFRAKHPNTWMPGFFSYDLKNETESLTSRFENPLDFPEAFFFIPRTIIKFWEAKVEIESDNPQEIYAKIIRYNNASTSENCSNVKVERKMSKKEYLEAFDKLQGHIQRGDIYEVNLCQEFFVKEVKINPLLLYSKLNSLSPTPFSCYVKVGNKFILSASPERFLAKRGNQLVSQPIKGTAPRGKTIEEDEQIKRTLRSNPKELAENVMIVDLVRNDLTKSALPGTVRADKQFEIHSFKQVHQLISTISCQLAKNTSAIQAIK